MQVVLGLGSGNLVYLEVGPGSIQQAGHLQLQAELACLDITPLGEDPDRAQIVVAGEAVKYCGGQCSVAKSGALLACDSLWKASVGHWHALQCRTDEQPHCAPPCVQHVHVMLLALGMACAVACTALSCNVVQPSNILMSVVLPLVALACPAGRWSRLRHPEFA